MYQHPHFAYIRRAPTWEDIVSEFHKPGVCDLTLNSRALNRQDGFAVHRVVLVEITGKYVVLHDPDKHATGEYRREPLEHFKKVVFELGNPELARYSLER